MRILNDTSPEKIRNAILAASMVGALALAACHDGEHRKDDIQDIPGSSSVNVSCESISVQRNGNLLTVSTTTQPAQVEGATAEYTISSSAGAEERTAESPDFTASLDGIGRHATIDVVIKFPAADGLGAAACGVIDIPEAG